MRQFNAMGMYGEIITMEDARTPDELRSFFATIVLEEMFTIKEVHAHDNNLHYIGTNDKGFTVVHGDKLEPIWNIGDKIIVIVGYLNNTNEFMPKILIYKPLELN